MHYLSAKMVVITSMTGTAPTEFRSMGSNSVVTTDAPWKMAIISALATMNSSLQLISRAQHGRERDLPRSPPRQLAQHSTYLLHLLVGARRIASWNTIQTRKLSP